MMTRMSFMFGSLTARAAQRTALKRSGSVLAGFRAMCPLSYAGTNRIRFQGFLWRSLRPQRATPKVACIIICSPGVPPQSPTSACTLVTWRSTPKRSGYESTANETDWHRMPVPVAGDHGRRRPRRRLRGGIRESRYARHRELHEDAWFGRFCRRPGGLWREHGGLGDDVAEGRGLRDGDQHAPG